MAPRAEERCPWEHTCPFAWVVRAGAEIRSGLADVRDRLPKGFGEHARTAQRETLLAMRALLDGLLDALEGKGRRAEKGRGRKIKVE